MEIRLIESKGQWLVKSKHAGLIVIPADRGWTWDGNVENPTIAPSLLERRGRGGQTYEEMMANPYWVNHVFIRAGYIEYLSDCTHAGAGTTERIEPFTKAEIGMYSNGR